MYRYCPVLLLRKNPILSRVKMIEKVEPGSELYNSRFTTLTSYCDRMFFVHPPRCELCDVISRIITVQRSATGPVAMWRGVKYSLFFSLRLHPFLHSVSTMDFRLANGLDTAQCRQLSPKRCSNKFLLCYKQCCGSGSGSEQPGSYFR